jgi:hypothetical protein
VLRAFGICGLRGRRPMICFIFFDMAKDKGRPNSRQRAKGKERPPLVARDAGSLQWPIAHARPWALVARLRAVLTHVFAHARPCGSSAMCQRHDLRLVALERSGDNRLVQCNLRQLGCRSAAAQLPMRCGVVGCGLGIIGGGDWRPVGSWPRVRCLTCSLAYSGAQA